MDEIKFAGITVGQNHKPFIIAEMSGNHNQSLERALSIIDAHKKPMESGDGRLLDESIDVEQLISEVTQAVSPFWLSIVEALGSIKFEDSVYEE